MMINNDQDMSFLRNKDKLVGFADILHRICCVDG
jgi:hypothetical protein